MPLCIIITSFFIYGNTISIMNLSVSKVAKAIKAIQMKLSLAQVVLFTEYHCDAARHIS